MAGSGALVTAESGSGLGEGFMMQTAQQRAEFKKRKGKPGRTVDDPLTKLRDIYYARGDCHAATETLLRSAEQHLATRVSKLLDRKQTKIIRCQKKFLAMWLDLISEEKKRRGLR